MSALSDELRLQADALIFDIRVWGGSVARHEGVPGAQPTPSMVHHQSAQRIREGQAIQRRLSGFYEIVSEHSAWDDRRDSGAIAQGVRVAQETDSYEPALAEALAIENPEAEQPSPPGATLYDAFAGIGEDVRHGITKTITEGGQAAAAPANALAEALAKLLKSATPVALALGAGAVAVLLVTLLVLRR